VRVSTSTAVLPPPPAPNKCLRADHALASVNCELFLVVGSGGEDAHRHFIVLATSKGNILVTADGVVKLLDFRLASS